MRSVLSVLLGLACAAGAAEAGCTVQGTPTCYVDNSTRLLGSANVAGDDLITLEYCAQLCADRNMTIAGAENGNECYCGNKLNWASPQKSSGCSHQCSGKRSLNDTKGETCGGTWRIAIFDFACSGSPEPAPVATPELVNPCLNHSSKFAAMPFCDSTLSVDARVDDAVSRMTLQEKISALGTSTGPIPSLGLPAYNWWSEASSGVASTRNTKTTKFAFPITTGMSFNRSQHPSAASLVHQAPESSNIIR